MCAVTIAVPVYNGGKYLARALYSAVNQKYDNKIITVSDNASCDDTGDICRDFSLRYDFVSYIRQERNIGALANFLYLSDISDSPYFMWLAHDDVLNKSAVDLLADALLKNDEVGFSFPYFSLASEKYGDVCKDRGRLFKFIQYDNWEKRVLSYYNRHPLMIRDMLYYSMFRKGALLASTSALSNGPDFFCADLLRSSRGVLVERNLLTKNYEKRWPGQKRRIFRLFSKKKERRFYSQVERSYSLAMQLFPEIAAELNVIKSSIHSWRYDKDFVINLDIENELNGA